MIELELLVGLLHPPKLLELGGHGFVDGYTLGHDHSFACLSAPTRQHERMNGKRLRNILDAHRAQLTQTNSSCLEFLAVPIRSSGAW